MAEEDKPFARHVKRLRRVRGLTQVKLAECCGLAADTIVSLEHGSFSPSLKTIRKLVSGLGISLSTLFVGFELNEADTSEELVELLRSRSKADIVLVIRVVRALLEELDRYRE